MYLGYEIKRSFYNSMWDQDIKWWPNARGRKF